MSFLSLVFSFILTIVILVSFHEYGHFWVARKCGVKVLRFSIGFGKPLWCWQSKDNVEYVIAAIPLGGYVKMLDKREVAVAESEMSQEFNSQPLAVRTAIVAAGPVFNFILALILYFIMFIIGVSSILPIVGSVTLGSPAADAGIREGDRIVMVDDQIVETWREAILELISADPNNSALMVTVRDKDQLDRKVFLDMRRTDLLSEDSGIESLGLKSAPPDLPPIIGKVSTGSAAQRGSLMVGDKIVAFNERNIVSWQALVRQIRDYPDQEVMITIEREGQRMNVTLRLDSTISDGRRIGQMGVQVRVDEATIASYQIHRRYGIIDSFMLAAEKTWDMSLLTLKILWRLLTGNAAASNIGGPLAIAQFASLSFAAGITAYLGLLALLSISLGILNLLPVPMLDGGHLLYYLIEFVKGSPVSEATQLKSTKIGLFLIVGLIIFALYNDLHRFFS